MQRQLRGEIESTTEATKLGVQARELDREIRSVAADARKSFLKLGQLIAKMRERRLWAHLVDREGKQKYRSLEDYVMSVVGPMARGKYFQIIAAHSLTEGENPIPAKTVERMGPIKAAELARLDPKDRTPEMVKSALEDIVPVVKRKVQAKLNVYLPPDERQEATVAFTINLPKSTRDRLEELLEVGIWMEGVRDGDRTQSLRQKFFGVMIFATENYFAQELAEAAHYLKARQAMEHGTSSGIEEDVCPPEPEELDAQEEQQDFT